MNFFNEFEEFFLPSYIMNSLRPEILFKIPWYANRWPINLSLLIANFEGLTKCFSNIQKQDAQIGL